MRRRSRETAGGEVAMMAVITKAMGAFLVLMIILLPYYTGDTQSQQTVDETRQRIDEAKSGLDSAVDRLKKGRLSDPEIDDLLARLSRARDELAGALDLIAQLKIKIDQAASQINRLEQQNAALQAENGALQTQIASLQGQIASLQAEIEALKQELARLRATDTATLQARIKELEAQIRDLKTEVAKIIPLQREVFLKQQEIDKLKAENDVLRVTAVWANVYLSSRCDRPGMIVDLVENPIGIRNFKPIDQLIPSIMPWAASGFDANATKAIPGETFNNSTTNVTLSFEEGREYQYDFFVRLRYPVPQDGLSRLYQAAEESSPKDTAGLVQSSRSHPGCSTTMFVVWRGKFEPVGVFRLGPVEPLVHVKRMLFSKDNTISFPPEDRPDIDQRIANETCAWRPAFCALATQHARLRARGDNPWRFDNLSDALFSGPAPRPTPGALPVRPEPGAAEQRPTSPIVRDTAAPARPGPPPPPTRPDGGVAPTR